MLDIEINTKVITKKSHKSSERAFWGIVTSMWQAAIKFDCQDHSTATWFARDHKLILYFVFLFVVHLSLSGDLAHERHRNMR